MVVLLTASAFLVGSKVLEAQSFQISSATYGTTGLSVVPAGANGATLTLTGTLPTVAQQAAQPLLACFYTGYGSTAGFALSAPNGTNTEPLVVPASTIQSIPLGQFTAANNYSITAQVYFISSDSTCDGTFDSDLTNQSPVQVIAPSLGTYTGPTSVPQTNPSTNLQAAPLSLNIPAGGFFTSANTAGATTIQFGSFGNVTLAIPATATSSINVPVPAAFSSSTVGTTASLSICNTLPGVNSPICITPSPAITLTVTALAASAGTITATPTPVLISGQTVLTAQFAKGANTGNAVNLGAPSGAVNFTADGNALAPAPLILDTTATFTAQTTSVFTPPTKLAFQVQAVNTPLNTAITPSVQVAVEDAAGTVVTNSTAPVTVGLYSDQNNGVLSGTLTVNAVNGIATFSDLTINALGTGYSIRAYSGNLTAVIGNAFNITPPAITMTVPSELVGINSTLNGSFTLSAPAPAGGLVVTLTSGTPANVTIAPATVTVAAGGTTGAFTYTGVAAGNSTLSGSAPSYQTGTVMTTATAAQVSLGMIPNVAPAQMQSIALSLATAAPAGGTTVTFTIANTNIATVTATSFVPAGQFTPAANPQVTGVLIGTTMVTATAPGYAPATLPVVVTVTVGFTPQTTNINLTTASTTSLAISAPAPPGGITFTLSADSPAIATVPASITVPAGATSVPIAITGVSAGTTTIRADSPGITEATGTVNVDSNIGNSTFTTGYDLEENTGLYLPVAPSAPTTVTVTVADPTVAVITTDNTVAGQTTLTFPNTTSSYIGNIYIQGLKIGTTTISVSAPGYTAGTITVSVNPSGFVINGYYATFSTTTYSSPTTLPVYPAILNTDLSYSVSSTLNPQSATLTVPVTSSSTAVGTVTSPLTFVPLNTQQSFSFQPVSTGPSTLSLGAPPAGFSVPTNYQTAVATVTTPAITVSGQTTAVHLINSIGLGLPEPPPTGQPVTVTLTSSDNTIFTLSSSATVVGTTSVTYPGTAGTSVGTLYVQGQKAGTATLTMSAPGYTSGTSTITVEPAGFFLGYPFTSFSTTTLSTPTGLNVYTTGLDANGNLSAAYLDVSPGVPPFTVSFTNSTPSVGTLSASSVTFNPGDNQHSINFQPVGAGTDTITLVTPTSAGFTTASEYQSNVATVTAPAIQVNGQETGVNLENSLPIYLPVAPPTGHPVTVTVTSSKASIATLSTSATTVGTASVTFTNVTSTNVGTVYVQGQGVGTATITETAADATTGIQNYTAGTNTLTVDPSGFTYYYNRPPFTTTTFSSLSQIPVYTTTIVNGNVYSLGLGISPGVTPVTVAVTDSVPSVGTISAAALVFNPGDGSHTFNFQPVSAGDTIVAISTPTGYTTGPYVSGDITVTAPIIQISNITTGVNLDGSIAISLPQTPPNPVTVTITSSSPALATLSTDPTIVGTSTVVFSNVTSQSVGTLYVQGQALGTAQLTETAPGYIDGNSTITVNPSGFVFYYGGPPFTASISSGERDLTVYTSVLAPGTLTIQQVGLLLNPGLGNVNVPVSSSNTAVGTYTPNPLVFTPGNGYVTGQFTPLTTGTTTVSVGTPTTPTGFVGFKTPSQDTSGVVTVQP